MHTHFHSQILKTTFFLALLFLAFSCKTQKEALSPVRTIELDMQSAIDSIYAVHPESIGIMVHVESPSRNISWSAAVGHGEKGVAIPLDPHRPALIASNTKTYTAASILRLIEQGNFQLDSPIQDLLSQRMSSLFISDGYELKSITVAHLLSHTSGVFDYVDADAFFGTLKEDPMHRWTAEEQLSLAVSAGEPLGPPGAQFKYADSNFLLLAEIVSEETNLPFYTAIRELLDYKGNHLDDTWFETLESQPIGAKSLVHQYSGSFDIHNYAMDVSFDLYGAGGIATTTEELARFSQLLFTGEFFDDSETLDLIYTRMPHGEGDDPQYLMGLMDSEIEGLQAYGHGGFWGTTVQYIPQLNTSISVFILERDERKLRKDVLESIVRELKK